MECKKVIIDTNLWISFLITNEFNFLDYLIEEGMIELIFSEELILEFIDVASRPKFRKYFSSKEIEQILALLDVYGKLVEVKSNINVCRDNQDNFLLNLAIDSQADYIITGDKDLLDIGTIHQTHIVTMKDFRLKMKV